MSKVKVCRFRVSGIEMYPRPVVWLAFCPRCRNSWLFGKHWLAALKGADKHARICKGKYE